MEGLDTSLVLQALMYHDDLWDKNKWRTTYENTPHGEIKDIWLRYAKAAVDLETKSPEVMNSTASVWYSPITFLPQVKPLVLTLMHKVEAYSLERLLITKLEPKGKIIPHADNGGDYVLMGDIARYHIVLNGKDGSMYRTGDETVCMKTGEVWWFNALVEHEVQNNSDEDRIHLIADMRLMP